jgi:predicted dehydrogenase
MAAIAKTLVASKVPFALEKPCGVSLSEVASLRDAAERACVHASVPFAFRCSEFFKQVMRRGAPGACSQMTFKFIVGSPRRYLDANCDWMLDPKIAGGGCTVNLAVHFFDLFKVFSGVVPTVAGAVMSNATHGLQIEDYSAVLLTGGRASGVVETGYTFPAAMGAFDLRFSLRSEGYYLTATGADAAAGDRLVVRGTTGEWEVIEAPASQVPYYAAFVRETLRRWRKGDPPIADLSDMCDAMEVLEAAYRAAGWTVKK